MTGVHHASTGCHQVQVMDLPCNLSDRPDLTQLGAIRVVLLRRQLAPDTHAGEIFARTLLRHGSVLWPTQSP